MTDAIYRLAGHLSLPFDWIRRRRESERGKGRYDKTGILVRDARRLRRLVDHDDLIVLEYDSLSHTFWRAQELSLFRRVARSLPRPILDFGCGDGSFASTIFPAIDYGADNDPEALLIAAAYGVYRELIRTDGGRIGLPDRSVQTIVSNSVLEHVRELDEVLAEFRRILRPGGLLVATVPLVNFTEQIARFFGRAESERINREYAHYNVWDEEQWRDRLRHHGFAIADRRTYQPPIFTFWYRMFRLTSDRGMGRMLPGIRSAIWKQWRNQLAGMIRESIAGTKEGANLFFIAKAVER